MVVQSVRSCASPLAEEFPSLTLKLEGRRGFAAPTLGSRSMSRQHRWRTRSSIQDRLVPREIQPCGEAGSAHAPEFAQVRRSPHRQPRALRLGTHGILRNGQLAGRRVA